jgi:hypothetical protein
MRSYTIYSPLLKQHAKQAGVSSEEYYDMARDQAKDWVAQHRSTAEIEGAYMACIYLAIDRVVMEGRATHLFLPEKPFCDWLVGCVRKLEPNHVGALEQAIGSHVGVLHFPTAHNLHSMAFMAPRESITYDDFDQPVNIPAHGALVATWGAGNNSCGMGALRLDRPVPPEVTDERLWYYKLVAGLGMYIGAFPDMMRHGPPQDLKHPSMHKYVEQATIGISPRVVNPHQGGTHASPDAHYRKGHFRVLRSAVFIKKRYQSVWVHEAFVKGSRVETVLAPEEVGQ